MNWRRVRFHLIHWSGLAVLSFLAGDNIMRMVIAAARPEVEFTAATWAMRAVSVTLYAVYAVLLFRMWLYEVDPVRKQRHAMIVARRKWLRAGRRRPIAEGNNLEEK